MSERASFGFVCRRGGTISDAFKGTCQVARKLLFESFLTGAFAQSLSDSSGGVVYPNPATGCVFGALEKRVREGRNPPVYASDCEGVLLAHALVGTRLPFSGMAAIGDMVTVDVLMSSAVGGAEDGEEEAR